MTEGADARVHYGDHKQLIDPDDRTWRLLDEILADWASEATAD